MIDIFYKVPVCQFQCNKCINFMETNFIQDIDIVIYCTCTWNRSIERFFLKCINIKNRVQKFSPMQKKFIHVHVYGTDMV